MMFTRIATVCADPAALRRGIAWRIAAACCVAMLSSAAIADDDLPGRVGRVADAAGGLYLSPEGQATEWTGIGVNYPITSGDNLWVADGGRAEVDYGGGQFRLAGATNLHVSRLDDRQLALFVAQGRLIVRIRVLDPGEAVRIDAPTAQVQLTRSGLYRIDVLPERQTTVVTIREGEALVALPSGVRQALPGQTVTIVGQDPAVAELSNGIGVDGFDTWSADRDRYYERSRATAYVSGQMVGAADLDAYGAWQTHADYGPVWFPNAVAVDWAPYRDGYWTNVGGWGATWVDAAPWGYAPFHYGRWASIGGRWGWCPGSYVPRPVWAPALVAWHGGPGWAVSASYGAPVYGWVPLGWREPYLPHWRGCSTRCWTQYNQPYAVDVRERPRRPPASYVNMAVPGAVTAVSGPTLGARTVAANRVRLPPQTAAAAPVLAAAPPMLPVRPQTPAGNAGSLPQPAVLLHPQRPRTVDPEANAGTTAPKGPAAPAGGTAPGAIAAPSGGRPASPPAPGNRGGTGPQAPASGPQGATMSTGQGSGVQPTGRGAAGPAAIDAGTAPTSARAPPPYRVVTPPAFDASGRVVETPYVRPGPQSTPQRPAPVPATQAASGATPQAAPQQTYGGTTGAAAPPVRQAPVQRVERSMAVPATPAAPPPRVDRGVAMPAAPAVPARPATVAVPPAYAVPAGAAPQTNLVRPPGRGGGAPEPAPTAGTVAVPVPPAPATGPVIK